MGLSLMRRSLFDWRWQVGGPPTCRATEQGRTSLATPSLSLPLFAVRATMPAMGLVILASARYVSSMAVLSLYLCLCLSSHLCTLRISTVPCMAYTHDTVRYPPMLDPHKASSNRNGTQRRHPMERMAIIAIMTSGFAVMFLLLRSYIARRPLLQSFP